VNLYGVSGPRSNFHMLLTAQVVALSTCCWLKVFAEVEIVSEKLIFLLV